MKKLPLVQVEKLPFENFITFFDVRAYTEDKGVDFCTVTAVENESGVPAPLNFAAVHSTDENLIGIRLNGGIVETNYKCTLVFVTNGPNADTYHQEIFVKVLPWRGSSQQLEKQPGDDFVWGFEFDHLLGGSDDGNGNAITNLSVQAVNHETNDPANVISPAGIDGSIAKVRVHDGASGNVYRCTVIVQGNNPNRTYGEVFFLNVLDL